MAEVAGYKQCANIDLSASRFGTILLKTNMGIGALTVWMLGVGCALLVLACCSYMLERKRWFCLEELFGWHRVLFPVAGNMVASLMIIIGGVFSGLFINSSLFLSFGWLVLSLGMAALAIDIKFSIASERKDEDLRPAG